MGWPQEFASDLSQLFFRLAVLTLFIGCGVYLVLLRVYVPGQWARTLAPAVGMVVAALAAVLTWRGQAWLAVRFLAIGVWLLITIPSFFLGGVHTPVIIAYPVVLLLVAWLFPASVSRAVLVLSVGALLFMGWGEMQGWLPAQPPTPTVLFVASQVLMLALTGIMASFAVGAYRRQLRSIKEQSQLAQEHSRELALRSRELAEAHDRWQSIFEHNPDPLLISRLADARITDVNEAALRKFGYTREDVLGRTSLELGLWARPQERQGLLDSLRQRGYCDHLETNLCLRDGSTVVASLTAVVTRLNDEPCVITAMHDITQRRQAQDALRLSASVFSHAREAIVITDAMGLIVDVNAAFTRITGYERSGVLGRPLAILYSGRQGHMPHEGMWQTLCDQGHWEGEVWMRRRNGEVFAVLESASAVRNPHGVIEHFVAMFSDITAQKRSQRRLERIAHYDALTNLPNRVLFSDRLQQAMAAATRHQRTMAVVFMDLDGFKEVNDQHGHAAGDQLLVSLAARMRQLVREGDTVARLGGDEFVAVLVDLVSVDTTLPLLDRLLAALASPVPWQDGVSLQVSASLGVVFYPNTPVPSTQKLMLLADAAMYRAKLAGKNRYVVADLAAPPQDCASGL